VSISLALHHVLDRDGLVPPEHRAHELVELEVNLRAFARSLASTVGMLPPAGRDVGDCVIAPRAERHHRERELLQSDEDAVLAERDHLGDEAVRRPRFIDSAGSPQPRYRVDLESTPGRYMSSGLSVALSSAMARSCGGRRERASTGETRPRRPSRWPVGATVSAREQRAGLRDDGMRPFAAIAVDQAVALVVGQGRRLDAR
jgi:hypothetical protein